MKIKLHLIASFLFFFVTANTVAQNEIQFDDSGYQSVLQRAKKEHKSIFYMIYASWCAHCNKMKEEVFKDTLVTHFMNKNFVNAWQDAEKGEGDYFKRKYGIKFYPTFIFIDENGKELYNISGEYTSANFITEAKNALTTEKQLPYLKQQFESDVTNADKCLAYLSALNKGRDRSLLAPVANQYLSTQKEAQLITATNWKIIANGVTDLQSREFQYVLQHQKEFEAVASPRRVQRKIGNIVSELLTPYVEAKDTLRYNQKRMIAKTINSPKNDSIVFTMDIELAEKVGDWKKYQSLTIPSVEKYVYSDQLLLQKISSNYLKYIADTASLKYAIKWMQHAMEIHETYEGQLLIAKLYQKSKATNNAILWANKAKDKNAAYGWKTKEADELLTELGQK